MSRMTARQLTLMAFCLLLGLLTKRIISPVTNVLTDFFRIPGGSASVGFSLAFLVIGREAVPFFGSATLMGLIQGLLALAMGMSGYQGPLAVFTYTLPGLIIDCSALVMKNRGLPYFLCASVLSCIGSALLSNILVFHLTGAAQALWLLLAACSGLIGGSCAYLLHSRVKKFVILEGRKQA